MQDLVCKDSLRYGPDHFQFFVERGRRIDNARIANALAFTAGVFRFVREPRNEAIPALYHPPSLIQTSYIKAV